MTKSVLSFDSLWKRVERKVPVKDIESKDEFRQRMIDDFFTDYTNPKGFIGNHDDLLEELWDRGLNEKRFLEVIRIREEEARKVEIDRFANMIKEDRWKRRYRELISEGIAPESAYDTVMEEIRGEKDASKTAEEIIEEIEERLPEITLPSERAVAIRIGKFERETAPSLESERKKYERLHKTLERSLSEEYDLR